MDAPLKTRPTGYTDVFGKPVDDDIEKWFKDGVKPIGLDQGGFWSKQTGLYITLIVICIVALLITIIVPIAVGNALPKKG